jgi:hypothetical protein
MCSTGLPRSPLFSALRSASSSALLGLALLGCGGGGAKPAPVAPAELAAVQAQRSPVVTWDILDREPVANSAEVKHILVGWKDLTGGPGDARAAARTKEQADQEVAAILAKARSGASFEELMAVHSEDQGSAVSGQSYKVAPDAGLVIEFKQLSLRLNPGEVGVCQSDFGYHVIKRFQ